MDKGEKRFYTVNEIAIIMGISLATAYEGLRTGQIPAHQVGRRWIISRTAFDYWFGDYPNGGDSSERMVGC